MIAGCLSLQEVKIILLSTCAETHMKRSCSDAKMIGIYIYISDNIYFVV